MANPLAQSIAQAERSGKAYHELMNQIGSAEHPRGFAMLAYRNARRALASDPSPLALREVMRGLKLTMGGEMTRVLTEAMQIGKKSALNQLAAYGQPQPNKPLPVEMLIKAQGAVEAEIDRQTQAALALLEMGQDVEEVLGGESQAGVIRPGPAILALTLWLVTLGEYVFKDTVLSSPTRLEFQKQAIAAIDGKTTDCCLRVHGQVVPLSAPFHLTGTPRFADRMDWSPFHWRCRTSIALYLPNFDQGTSEAMTQAAAAEMVARRSGQTTAGRYNNAYGRDG